MPSATIADGVPQGHPSTRPGASGASPDAVPDDVSRLLAQVWQPRFPSPELVELAADMFPAGPGDQGQEGPIPRISVAPGLVQVWTRDEARYERTQERARQAQTTTVDAMVTWLIDGDDVPERQPTREIMGWSRKSRTNMRKTIASLDLTTMFADPTRLPAVITCTYPGCWLPVAPNGKAVKRHMAQLRKRYARAFGEPFTAVWKLEFQRRLVRNADGDIVYAGGAPIPLTCRCETCDDRDDGRAPHLHMLMAPPRHAAADGRYFKQWLSQEWADIVDHPDPEQRRRNEAAGTNIRYDKGLRMFDPRRVADYFEKHGSFKAKEYQHCVPEVWREPGEGPGRFWGYWGLETAVATRQVTDETATDAGRTLRRYSRAQGVTRAATRPRVRGGRPISQYPEIIGLAGAWLVESRQVTYRTTRTRAVRLKANRGWVQVNDGPAFASQVALAVHQRQEDRWRAVDQMELERCGLVDDPLARARRLAPGPRRDALVARLTARTSARPLDSIDTETSVLTEIRRPVVDRPARDCSVCGGRLAEVIDDRHLLCGAPLPEPMVDLRSSVTQ